MNLRPKRCRDQRRNERYSAPTRWYIQAVQLAGFTLNEANKYFGAPDEDVARGLVLKLRPPVDVREDFVGRHAALLAEMS